MHPLILYDANKPGDLEKTEALGADILKLCVEVGGCLTGEHGVGVEKREIMTAQYGPDDLEIQMQVKDVFDPAWVLNPAKVFPLDASAGRERLGAGGAVAAPRTPRRYLGQRNESDIRGRTGRSDRRGRGAAEGAGRRHPRHRPAGGGRAAGGRRSPGSSSTSRAR